jgi:two-component system nitrate/nitrite response regulator NarL
MTHSTDVGTDVAAIRIIVADDHAIIRKGIRAMVDVVPDIELVGEATNGREAVIKAREQPPDVILMDLVMPEMDGIEAIRRNALPKLAYSLSFSL